MTAKLTLILPLAILVLISGCGSSGTQAVSAPPPAPEKKDEKPNKLPGEEEAPGATEVLITTPASAGSRRDQYVQDEKTAAGTLRGICKFAGISGRVKVPGVKPVDLSASENAIPGAMDGEKAYYENIKMKEQVFMDGNGAPTGAVIIIRNVKIGRLPQLDRPGFMVKGGSIGALGFSARISAGNPGERVQMGTFDKFPCDLVLSAAAGGKPLFEGRVVYEDKWKPGDWLHAAPNLILSSVVKDPGYYTVTCKRHPWQKAFLVITDNPYVAAAEGRFEVVGVPVGAHTMEIWHSKYEPVEKTMQINIKENEVTEVGIEFKAPADLVVEKK